MSKKKQNHTNDKPSLEDAANEWAPDASAAKPAQPSEQPSDSVVTLVHDPFNIPTIEIAEAQENPNELFLEDDFEEPEIEAASPEKVEEEMQNLANALAAEQAKQIEDMKTIASESEVEAANRLADEIAEDQALEREMAREQEEAAAAPVLQTGENGELDLAEVQSCIEALLFITEKPISIEKLRDLLGPDFSLSLFQEAMTAIQDRYKAVHHGFELAQIGGGYQFRTKAGRADLAKKLAKIQTQRLSSGAMETLAIVAYRQPVMKEEIDKVRGVDSSHFIRGLMDKKLIKISGRSELPGRPMLYATTPEFLELFGLKDLSALPPLRELEQMVPSAEFADREEDPRVKEMRRLVAEMKSDKTRIEYDHREDERILKEIRERVNSIPISTPYIEQQKELEKQAAIESAPMPAAPIEP